MKQYAYHPDMPADCPLEGAEPVGEIYRAVPRIPVTAENFAPDVETNPRAKRGNCKHWGCSVWRDLAAVEHGRKTYSHFRDGYILKGVLSPSDGQVLTTPSKAQPQHTTFWKVHGVDVAHKFKVLYHPETAGTFDPFDPGAE